MNITLTALELEIASSVAKARMDESVKHDRQDRLYNKTYEEGLRVHYLGVCGELAAARALNLYPPLNVGEFRGMKPDLVWDGTGVEVRHRVNPKHDLIVRPGDAMNRYYVLTTGTPPSIEVVGYGRPVNEESLQKYKKDYGSYSRPAYFMPQSELTRI